MNYNIDTKEGMENAIRWQQGLIDSINDGGFWMVPRSLSIFRLDKKNKIAVQETGMSEPTIIKVFEAMGWTAVTELEKDIAEAELSAWETEHP